MHLPVGWPGHFRAHTEGFVCRRNHGPASNAWTNLAVTCTEKCAVWLGASAPWKSLLLAGGDAGMLWFVTKGKRRPLTSLQAVRLELNQREPGLGENFLTALQGQSASWPASLGSCLGCPRPNEQVCLATCAMSCDASHHRPHTGDAGSAA